MRTLKGLLTLLLLALPALAGAEVQKLECSILFRGFTDSYSIEIDTGSGRVSSTYHAAASKDNRVTVDYQIASEAVITGEKIVFEAKLHSLDYIFEINRTTLGITRYIDNPNEEEVGRGSCQAVDVSGKRR